MKKILRPNFEKRNGLVSVIAQEVRPDGSHGSVLMQAFTDEAGFLETLRTRKAVYYSTSRNERWCKGETSGDFQHIIDVLIDCDGDALIYLVAQEGDGACHTGARSCFFRCVVEGIQIMDAPKAGSKEELSFVEAEVDPLIGQTDA